MLQESRNLIFSNRRILSLWSAHTIALIGTNTGFVVLPLIALNFAGASVFEMGILEAAESLAVMLFGIWMGRVPDAIGGRPSLIIANLLRALALVTIPIAFVLGTIEFWHIFCVVFLIGAGSLLYQSALSTMVVHEFNPSQWVKVNSAFEGSSSVTETFGPGIGGFLVQVMSAPFAVLVDIISYVLSALICIFRREPDLREDNDTSASEEPSDTKSPRFRGLSFIWQSPSLRAITLSAAHFNFFAAGFAGTVMYFMVRDLGFSSFQVGLTSVASGLLGIIAAVSVSRVVSFSSTRTLYALSYIISGAAALLVPVSLLLGSRQIAFVFVSFGLGIWAFAIVVNLVMSETIKLDQTPKQLVGEVSSSIRWVSIGVEPIGALIGGAVATFIGAGPWLVFASLGLASAAIWVYFVGDLKGINISSLDDERDKATM